MDDQPGLAKGGSVLTTNNFFSAIVCLLAFGSAEVTDLRDYWSLIRAAIATSSAGRKSSIARSRRWPSAVIVIDSAVATTPLITLPPPRHRWIRQRIHALGG
jgi:hypothetical protein